MRIYLNPKEKVEDCLALSVFALNKAGIFKQSSSGNFSWTIDTCNIDYVIDLDFSYIKLSYSIIQKNIEDTFLLQLSRCNYGGYRYWFVCKCRKQVGLLYKTSYSDYFRCRACHNLTYESRNLSGSLKRVGKPLSISELNLLREKTKKIFYKGKLTKGFIKYKQKLDRFKSYHENWFGNFKKRFIKSK